MRARICVLNMASLTSLDTFKRRGCKRGPDFGVLWFQSYVYTVTILATIVNDLKRIGESGQSVDTYVAAFA